MMIKPMFTPSIKWHLKTGAIFCIMGCLFAVLSVVTHAADAPSSAATSLQRKGQPSQDPKAKKEVYVEPGRKSRASNVVVVDEIASPLSNNAIRDMMIRDSIKRHSPCACPYSPDAIGGQCGTEAKYYKPGGFRIYCYRIDISSEEVHFYRLRRAYRFDAKEKAYLAPVSQTDKDPTQNYFRNNAPSLANKRKANAISDMTNDPTFGDRDPTADYFINNAEGYYNPSNNNFPANNPTTSSSSTGAINYQYNPYNPYGTPQY